MMNKKAQELPIQTVVVGILILIALIILILIFTGTAKMFLDKIKELFEGIVSLKATK